jgi:site-specific recombinase XerC
MRESGLGVGGANNYIRAWQVFCNWLADRGYIDRFRIPHIPQQKTRKPVFDQGQAIAVIRCKPKAPSVKRAQAMFALMLDTAIRFGEFSLFRSDIDARSGLITVRGKTGEQSRGILNPPLGFHLGTIMLKDHCRHTHQRVSDLIATTSRLNSRAFRMSALACNDCGKILITDSVQSIHQILRMLEALEERISAIERANHYRIAA